MVEGRPGFLISPECPTLIKGFMNGYQYRRMKVSGEARHEDKPDKNKYSHVHDALQYLMLGAGEGRKMLNNARANQMPVNGKRDINIWDRTRRNSLKTSTVNSGFTSLGRKRSIGGTTF